MKAASRGRCFRFFSRGREWQITLLCTVVINYAELPNQWKAPDLTSDSRNLLEWVEWAWNESHWMSLLDSKTWNEWNWNSKLRNPKTRISNYGFEVGNLEIFQRVLRDQLIERVLEHFGSVSNTMFAKFRCNRKAILLIPSTTHEEGPFWATILSDHSKRPALVTHNAALWFEMDF